MLYSFPLPDVLFIEHKNSIRIILSELVSEKIKKRKKNKYTDTFRKTRDTDGHSRTGGI